MWPCRFVAFSILHYNHGRNVLVVAMAESILFSTSLFFEHRHGRRELCGMSNLDVASKLDPIPGIDEKSGESGVSVPACNPL